MAPCWSLARLVRAPGGGRLCHRLFTAVGPVAERRSARHHCPQHEECGLSSSSVLVLAVAVAVHTHRKAIIPLLHLGFWRCVGAATSAPGIGGSQLQYTVRLPQWRQGQVAWTVARAMRGSCMWPDGNGTCPLGRVLLAEAMVWRLRSSSPMDLKLCDLYPSAFSYLSFII
jgi:hypothetical protein